MSEDEIRRLLSDAAGEPTAPPVNALVRRVRSRRRRAYLARAVTVAVVTSLVIGGLNAGVLRGSTRHGGGVALAADLTPYPSCAALLTDLQNRAFSNIGPYGYASDGAATSGLPVPEAATAGAAKAGAPALTPQSGAASGARAPEAASIPAATTAAGGTAGAASGDVPQAHSSTTDRTRGVDEPDLTKTDGKLLLSLTGGVLRVYDAVHPKLLGSVTVSEPNDYQGYPGNKGYQVVVPPDYPSAGSGQGILLNGTDALVTGLRPGVQRSGDTRGTTTIDAVDLGDPTKPRITRRLSLDGEVVSALLVSGLPRLVLHSAAPNLRWFTPTGSSAADQAAATERNQQLLRQSTIADWLPTYDLTDGAGKDLAHGQLFSCDRVAKDTAPSDGTDLVGVTAFDPAATTALAGGLAVVGGGDTAYVSSLSAGQAHLWIATGSHGGGFGCLACPRLSVDPRAGSSSTQLHGFDITDATRTTEIGSTTLAGSLADSYSVNETELQGADVLSVALSHGGPEPGEGGQNTSLVDLTVGNGRVTQVGALDDLSPGESLQSVRWIGSFGYLVTFQQIDPLVVVDFSDPAKPERRASLPSADTSTQLLQTDVHQLLGLGNGSAAGRYGTVAKVYDVSDPDHPALRTSQVVVDQGSPAASDPHALLYWRAGRLLFLPSYDGKLVVDQLTAAGDLSQRFVLSQQSHDPQAQLQRAVLIGRSVWTIGSRAVMVSSLANGAELAYLPN